jgi:hypothetical protein
MKAKEDIQDSNQETQPKKDPGSESGETAGVTVPEEFQKQVHSLVKGANKHHLSHMRDRINMREDELREQEMKKKSGSQLSQSSPAAFSAEEMPAD